jgi:hypothetical protein
MSALFEARATSASFAPMCLIRRLASKFEQYFLKQTLCLICRVPFVNRWRLPKCQRINSNLFSLFRNFAHPNWRNDICKPESIIIKSNYFHNAQKCECFLDDFEALVREIDVRSWLLRSRNVILKVASSKKYFCKWINSMSPQAHISFTDV